MCVKCVYSCLWGFYLSLASTALSLHHCRGISLIVSSGGYSLVVVRELLIVVVSPVVERGLWACGLQQLWHSDLIALQHLGSSRTRDQTHVACVGRWTLNPCLDQQGVLMLVI